MFLDILLSPNQPWNYLRDFDKIIQLFLILYMPEGELVTDLQLW